MHGFERYNLALEEVSICDEGNDIGYYIQRAVFIIDFSCKINAPSLIAQ